MLMTVSSSHKSFGSLTFPKIILWLLVRAVPAWYSTLLNLFHFQMSKSFLSLCRGSELTSKRFRCSTRQFVQCWDPNPSGERHESALFCDGFQHWLWGFCLVIKCESCGKGELFACTQAWPTMVPPKKRLLSRTHRRVMTSQKPISHRYMWRTYQQVWQHLPIILLKPELRQTSLSQKLSVVQEGGGEGLGGNY